MAITTYGRSFAVTLLLGSAAVVLPHVHSFVVPSPPSCFTPPHCFALCRRRRQQPSHGNTQLFLGSRVQIRDWRPGDGESILNILTSIDETGGPEGPLSLDCVSEDLLQESYGGNDKKDGCMLVATTTNNNKEQKIIGTAGLVVGTPVTYFKSGASLSSPEKVTGAIRRVACGAAEEDRESILDALLRAMESRALQAGATELIVLAYNPTNHSKNCQPSAALLNRLGYYPSERRSTANIENVVQYTKVINKQ